MQNTGEEIWRTIPSLPDYQASNAGRIRSIKSGKVLKGCLNDRGYIKFCLSANGGNVHRIRSSLVAEAWLGKRPEKMVVCHENGIPTDDRLENLNYKTQKENIADKYRHNTILFGERNPRAAITEEIAEEIFLSRDATEDLSKRLSVSSATIDAIRNRKSWLHITSKYGEEFDCQKRQKTSKYKGVSLQRGKWIVQITKNKKNYTFRDFANEEEAAEFYMQKRREILNNE